MTRQPRPTSHRPKLGAMSVSLLNELMHNTLDAGYAEAAARRRRTATGHPPPRRALGHHLLTALGLLLIGVVLGAGYQHTQRQAPDSENARQALVRDVEREAGISDQLQRRAEQLTEQLADTRDAALARSQAGDQAADRLDDLESAAALTSVEGPGVTVTLGDAPPATRTDPVTGEPVVVPPDENGKVLDRDLQSIVNALWSAGAEAISIDGARLSATTPIRAAGDAILVDLLPVSSPYTIEAIGDPDRLLPRFVDTPAASRFATFSSTFGIEFSVGHADRLRLRAATGIDPGFAEPVPAATPPRGDGSTTGAPGPAAPTTGGGR